MNEFDTANSVIALIADGDSYWTAGQENQAFRCYAEAVSKDPACRRAAEKLALFMLVRLAKLCNRDGAARCAMDAYRAFLMVQPGNAKVSAEFGLRLFQFGKVEEASQHLSVAFSTAPSLAEYVVQRLVTMMDHAIDNPPSARGRFFGLEQLSRVIPQVAEVFGPVALDLVNSELPVVCIAGMHRSGTSMLAGLLQDMGLDLGPEDRLLPPNPDNPEGYFENREIMRLQEDLLAGFGGGWDSPPALVPGWERSDAAYPYRNRAALLAAALSLGAGELGWGWKDPRNCLTLPLWLDLFPDIKVVVIFRDPGSVASSLQKRGGYLSFAFGLQLWNAYHQALLAALQDRKSIVVSYENFLQKPSVELHRITDFIGWNLPEHHMASAVGRVRRQLRHHYPNHGWRNLPAGTPLKSIFEHLVHAAKGLP